MHLHVISEDYCSPALKTKRHYNSFHPKLGFFLHLHEVMEWFEADQGVFNTVRMIDHLI
jgi:aprataxin